MLVIYLVQGARDKLDALRFPTNAVVYALCYDVDFHLPLARETIFDPHCTWAEGRNILQARAMAAHDAFDYLIFCDDDIEFISGSFALFERRLEENGPLAAIPLMPKARVTGCLLKDRSVQRAIAVDEQMVALHRSAVGRRRIAPLETAYDAMSWYVACLLFEYHALHAFGAGFHQFNDVEIVNRSHTWADGGTLYRQGASQEFLPVVVSLIRATPNYDPEILEAFHPQCLPQGSNFDHAAARARRMSGAHQISRLPDDAISF